jgi:hypothetical protein
MICVYWKCGVEDLFGFYVDNDFEGDEESLNESKKSTLERLEKIFNPYCRRSLHL